MKKIILILLILGLIGIGFIGAVSLEIIDSDFTEKVLVISTEKLCEIELLSNVFEKKCTKDTLDTIDISDSKLSILKDSKTGIIRVKNE